MEKQENSERFISVKLEKNLLFRCLIYFSRAGGKNDKSSDLHCGRAVKEASSKLESAFNFSPLAF